MKILLATDGSEYSERAADFLTRIPWTPNDTITVFHAIYALPFRQDDKFYQSQLTAIKKELAPRILDSAAAILKSTRANLSVEIKEGPLNRCAPEECIAEAAEELDAGLVVMGGRGTKGTSSVFLGSVTRQVAIMALRPILVVKPSMQPRSDKLHILFATDGSPCSRATADLLAAIPFSEDTKVTILHVLTTGFADIPERYILEVNERVREVAEKIKADECADSERMIDEARKRLQSRFSSISSLTKEGDPTELVLRAAGEHGVDLIAVGSRGLRGVKGVLGSVSRNILTHANCSVLIGKTGPCAAP